MECIFVLPDGKKTWDFWKYEHLVERCCHEARSGTGHLMAQTARCRQVAYEHEWPAALKTNGNQSKVLPAELAKMR